MKDTIDHIVSLCKRRGFVYQSSDIYNGLASAWDYGPLGVELKQNIFQFWWQEMVRLNDNIVGIDAAILMHPTVWKASGHVDSFVDVMVEDTVTKERFRWDHLSDEHRKQSISPKGNPLTKPKNFNLMFTTHIGSTDESGMQVYLRPETAQGIYVNFKNVLQSNRLKIPFGIAQMGKSFRNEIVTKNFIFRTCEFEQLEMQFFVKSGTDEEWFDYWKEKRIAYYDKMGIKSEHLRFSEHGPKELAHYAKAAFDIEYQFPFGWSELEGIHNRSDYDLSQHMKFSNKDLQYVDENGDKFVPYIIETSAGLTRSVLMVLCDAYEEEKIEEGDIRTVLHLHPKIAPIMVGVFPLVKKDGLPETAKKIAEKLREDYSVFYDQSGAIGRRYRRLDEIGTPFCITVDYETSNDDKVTVRYRDSMKQERVPILRISEIIREKIASYSRGVV